MHNKNVNNYNNRRNVNNLSCCYSKSTTAKTEEKEPNKLQRMHTHNKNRNSIKQYLDLFLFVNICVELN